MDETKTALKPLVLERRRNILRTMALTQNSATGERKRAARQALAALDALEKYWKKPTKPKPANPEPIAAGAHGENPSGQVDEATGGEGDTTEAPKALSDGGMSETKTMTTYASAFKRLTRSLFRGSMTRHEFVDNLFTTMRKNFLTAWQEGRDAVSAGKMTDDDILRVQDIVSEQATYAPGFAEFVEKVREDGGKWVSILPRAEMWVNKYGEVIAEAMASAKGEQRLKWVWDEAKEHCSSCRDLNGRVYTAATWSKQNLRPMSMLLECGPGRNCGCRFEPTNEPITKGPFPVWVGKPRRKSLSDLMEV